MRSESGPDHDKEFVVEVQAEQQRHRAPATAAAKKTLSRWLPRKPSNLMGVEPE
jgi:hypothetical protein